MKKLRIKTSLLVSASAVAGLAMGAGIAMAAHPPIQLYTYEEVARQMYGPALSPSADGTFNFDAAPNKQMPIIIPNTSNPAPNTGYMQGMPYSPKQTCGAVGCHDGATTQNANNQTIKNLGYAISPTSKYYGKPLVGYAQLADHAFHAMMGRNEM